MSNQDVREYAMRKNVRLWQIASELGIHDGTLSKKLRTELDDCKKKEIFCIIDKLAMQKEA